MMLIIPLVLTVIPVVLAVPSAPAAAVPPVQCCLASSTTSKGAGSCDGRILITSKVEASIAPAPSPPSPPSRPFAPPSPIPPPPPAPPVRVTPSRIRVAVLPAPESSSVRVELLHR